jgi:hypothetical protein
MKLYIYFVWLKFCIGDINLFFAISFLWNFVSAKYFVSGITLAVELFETNGDSCTGLP